MINVLMLLKIQSQCLMDIMNFWNIASYEEEITND